MESLTINAVMPPWGRREPASDRPGFLNAGIELGEVAGLEVLGGIPGITLAVRFENQSYILFHPERLNGLTTSPEDSAAKVTQALLDPAISVVAVSGAMRSGKSEDFNQAVIRVVNDSLRKDIYSPPVLVARAQGARRLDTIVKLGDQIGGLVPFNYFNWDQERLKRYEIWGPLQLLRFVQEQMRWEEKGIKLVALEEAGLLLPFRGEYLGRLKQDLINLDEIGIPVDLQEQYLSSLTDEDLEQGFRDEFSLMLEIFKQWGVKLLLTDVDRFTSGKPWEPTPLLLELAGGRKDIYLQRKFSTCVCCGRTNAVISAVTQDYSNAQDWQVVIGPRAYELHPLMHDLQGLVRAIEPYYAPLCQECHDKIRPEASSAGWPAMSWSAKG